MKTFEFADPNGKTHTLEGPDDATPEQAFAILQQQLGAQGGSVPFPELRANQRTVESNNNPSAVSKAGAMGIDQFMPKTAIAELGSKAAAFDPVKSGVGADRMMKRLTDKYNGSQILALQAYNWGEGNVDAFLRTGKGAKGQTMPPETKAYAGKVLGTLSKPPLRAMEPLVQGFQEAGGGIQQFANRTLAKIGVISPEEAQASDIRALAQQSDYTQRREAEGKTGVDWLRVLGNVLPNGLFPETKIAQGLAKIPHVAPAAARILTSTLQGSVGAGSQLARNPEEQLQNAATGAAFGGVLSGLGAGGRAAFGGKQLNPARQKLLETARDLGLQPLPSAASGSYAAKRAEQLLNTTFGGTQAIGAVADKNNVAISKGISKLFGMDEPVINDTVVAKIRGNIDDLYDTALKERALAPDKQLITDLTNLVKNAPLESTKKLLQSVISDIPLRKPMGSEVYNKIRSEHGRRATAAMDGMTDDAYNAVQDVLDDWAIRRLPAASGKALGEARNQFWLYKQIVPALDPASGVLNTSKLATTLRNKSETAFMTGNKATNPLVPFSRMAEFTKKMPSPLASTAALSGLAAGGTMYAYGPENKVEALGSGLFGLAVPYLIAKGYLSPTMRKSTTMLGQGVEGALMNSPYVSTLFGRND
jgi:hypothetical protein